MNINQILCLATALRTHILLLPPRSVNPSYALDVLQVSALILCSSHRENGTTESQTHTTATVCLGALPTEA